MTLCEPTVQAQWRCGCECSVADLPHGTRAAFATVAAPGVRIPPVVPRGAWQWPSGPGGDRAYAPSLLKTHLCAPRAYCQGGALANVVGL